MKGAAGQERSSALNGRWPGTRAAAAPRPMQCACGEAGGAFEAPPAGAISVRFHERSQPDEDGVASGGRGAARPASSRRRASAHGGWGGGGGVGERPSRPDRRKMASAAAGEEKKTCRGERRVGRKS